MHGHQLSQSQRATLQQQLLQNNNLHNKKQPPQQIESNNTNNNGGTNINNLAMALGIQQQQQQQQQLKSHQANAVVENNQKQQQQQQQRQQQQQQQPQHQQPQQQQPQQQQQRQLQMQQPHQQPQKKPKVMDNVMFRQREQLRGLQNLLKNQSGDLTASFLPQDQGNNGGSGMMPQRSSLIQQQQQLECSNRSLTNPSRGASISPTPILSGIPSQQPMMNPTPPAQQSAAMGGIASSAASGGNQPRVIPVSIAPSGKEGGVSDAALAYTKHALDAIITSLNSNKEKYGDIGKVYTARDLSTCLGAWDLSVRHLNNKRPKFEESPTMDNMDEDDANTAFNFYYERSCPILLNAKRSSGPMPFCVDDFGSGGLDDGSNDDDLPDVVGAIVLTYGADSKFTGGVGEEGVLTKAIIEFFFDPRIVLLGTVHEGKEVTNDVLFEAEEQLFTQTIPDGNISSLLTASMTALTPSASLGSSSTAPSDDGVYIPTIWSGNTEREYKYCLLSTLNDKGQESGSKRVCVAIQNRNNQCAGDKGPAKGVCRITLTLSPTSVQAKKELMAKEKGEDYDYQTSSAVHRNIRDNIRVLRPPKLTTVTSDTEAFDVGRPNKRRRQALRRTSISKLIDPTLIAVGIRCKHELLLDDDEVGKVYVNGMLVADCNLTEHGGTSTSLNRIPNADALPAHLLFGVDFTLPSHNGLPSKSVLEREYGFLLMDALITPHPKADVVGKVLNRLISGKTEGNEVVDSDGDDANQNEIKFDTTSSDCFESIVLSSTKVDPVGISAKSLGTKFRMQHGAEAFPCEIGTGEEKRLHKLIGAQKVAKLVPTRARNILRRGGYLGLEQMAAFIWRSSASSWDGDHNDSVRATEAIEEAIRLLQKVGCENITPHNIRFVSRKQLGPAGDVSKLRSWYDTDKGIYYISDAILFQEAVQECSTSEAVKIIEGAVQSDAGLEDDDSAKNIANGQGEEGNGGDEENKGKGSDEAVDSEQMDKKESKEKRESGEKEDNTENAMETDKEGKLQPENEIKNSSRESEKSGPTTSSLEDVAYLLAFYIAKEHPNVMMLEKFTRSQRAIK
ncbi:hypothetical protein ACHAWT_009841 [Skeletonema menzelii]